MDIFIFMLSAFLFGMVFGVLANILYREITGDEKLFRETKELQKMGLSLDDIKKHFDSIIFEKVEAVNDARIKRLKRERNFNALKKNNGEKDAG